MTVNPNNQPTIISFNRGNRTLLTYSCLKDFKNCRRRFYWKYERQLEPELLWDEALYFGSVWHDCLELYLTGSPLMNLATFLSQTFDGKLHDDTHRKIYNYVTAMLKAYIQHYKNERDELKIKSVEQEFETDIINPENGQISDSFTMGGKVDLITYGDEGGLVVTDHKTATETTVNSGYIDRLEMDFQLNLYSKYISRIFNTEVHTMQHNTIVKPQLRQGKGETENEYQVRYQALCAKSKTGKSSAKRKIPESDEAFQARVLEWYHKDPKNRFFRIPITVNPEKQEDLEREVWELTQQILDCRKRDVWYKNEAHCFEYQKKCPYFDICSNNDNETIIENCYMPRDQHSELTLGDKVQKENEETVDEIRESLMKQVDLPF